MEKKKSVTTTIRMPVELRVKIDTLATKRLMSVNAYIVHALEQYIKQ